MLEAFDTEQQMKVMVKVSKKFKNSKDLLAGEKDASDRFISQAYAYLMAKRYRQKTAHLDAPPIFYVRPYIYRLKQPKFGVLSIYAEPMITIDGDWQKYMNNWAYCGDESMASFAHFAHVESQGLFMIPDLQGIQNILSDPAIHSLDPKIFKERTNMGS